MLTSTALNRRNDSPFATTINSLAPRPLHALMPQRDASAHVHDFACALPVRDSASPVRQQPALPVPSLTIDAARQASSGTYSEPAASRGPADMRRHSPVDSAG